MTGSALLAWVVLSTGLVLAPGPDTVLAVSYAVRCGLRDAMWAVWGGTVGGIWYMALCGFGFLSVLAAYPILYTTVKIAGAIYLAWLGLKLVSGALKPRFRMDDETATGARDALLLNKSWAAANGIPRPGTHAIQAQTGWGGGGPSRSLVFRGGTLKLGDVSIVHPLTEVSTNKGGALAASAFPNDLGGGVLKRFVVTLDYDHDSLFLKPLARPIGDLDTFDRSGMWINAAPGGFKVISITKGGPAEAAGLAEGDLITAINGRKAVASELPAVRMNWRNQPPGTAVSLKVQRGSTSSQIRLILRNMI